LVKVVFTLWLYLDACKNSGNNDRATIEIENIVMHRIFTVLTDHRQIVTETARLTLSEIHSASVRCRVVAFYIVNHQNRWARESCSEKGAWAENARIRRVLRLRHRLLSRIDSVTKRNPTIRKNL